MVVCVRRYGHFVWLTVREWGSENCQSSPEKWNGWLRWTCGGTRSQASVRGNCFPCFPERFGRSAREPYRLRRDGNVSKGKGSRRLRGGAESFLWAIWYPYRFVNIHTSLHPFQFVYIHTNLHPYHFVYIHTSLHPYQIIYIHTSLHPYQFVVNVKIKTVRAFCNIDNVLQLMDYSKDDPRISTLNNIRSTTF